MDIYLAIKFISLLMHVFFGIFIILKNPRESVNQAFSLMVFSIAVFEFGHLMLLILPTKSIWLKIIILGQCLLSANTVLFSLIYGRQNYKEHLQLRKPYLIIIYSFLLVFIILILFDLLKFRLEGERTNFYILFTRKGLILILFLFSCSLLTLVNLENTYRQAKKSRKRLKYSIVLFMGMLAFQLLIYSFSLGLSYINLDILIVSSIALIMTNMLIFFNIIKPKTTGIYISRTIIAKSYTMLLAGIYLLVIGMLSQIIQIIGKNLNFFVAFLSSFIILLVIMAIIVSKSLKERFQSFVERNFYKSKYDYRREWENFSKRVFTILNIEDLSKEILKTVSDSVDSDIAVLFLLDENKREYFIAKSLENEQSQNYNNENLSSKEPFLDWLWRYGVPFKIENGVCITKGGFTNPPEVPYIVIRLLKQTLTNINAICIPIITENNLIGFMVLGHTKYNAKPLDYSQEDIDLLETMATQISIAIMNAKRSYQLSIAHELESFNRFSAILLHDLKSSASMLSLVVQNAIENFDNPEFRKDAFSTINNVVNRIQRLIIKFSSTTSQDNNIQNLNLVDLNDVVRNAISVSGVQKISRIKITENLGILPKTIFDSDDIESVIMNIILNAIESITDNGIINIVTASKQNYVQVSISDTGCGMSHEFIRYKLFQPFQTTKSRGLGIGLYQCKTIVEAYGGFIDVQSQEGIGSIFTVNLPIKELVDE